MSLVGAGTARATPTDTTVSDADIAAIIDERAVSAVFLPVVRLDTFAIVGFEALARGPQGTPLEAPRQLFARATAIHREAELDWICRAAAYRAALDAKLHPSISVFVNTDPRRLAASCPPDLAQAVWRAESKLRVIIEVSESTLTSAPSEVAAAMERARRVGWGVALDNVGADPNALPLMSVVQPDVVKVDLTALDRRNERHLSLVVNAVLAESERTGATILVEGIETKRDLALARTMGAEVGQGFLFGKPGPLPVRVPAVPRPVQLMPPSTAPGRSPFEIVARGGHTRPASASALDGLRQHLENGGRSAGPSLVAAAWAMDGALASPLIDPAQYDGPRLSRFAHERDVAVVGSHFAAALVSRDKGEELGASDRRFECCVTYDRDLVLEVARAMFDRADARGPAVTTAFVE